MLLKAKSFGDLDFANYPPLDIDKPASGFSRGVDKFEGAQQERRHQEPSHSKLLHVRVMRSLSLRNLIREVPLPAARRSFKRSHLMDWRQRPTLVAISSDWSAIWLRVQSPVRPNAFAPGSWLRSEASNKRV